MLLSSDGAFARIGLVANIGAPLSGLDTDDLQSFWKMI